MADPPNKIAAVCVTFLRPRALGHLIRAWLDQDFRKAGIDAELVILDDAGQYDYQRGEDWRLISIANRFPTLGDKRNEAMALASEADADAFAVWDDDDYYLPWAIRASIATLQYAEWSRPSQVLIEKPHGSGILHRHRTGGLFHGGMAYTRKAFERAEGYPAMDNGEDQAFFARLKRAGACEADPLDLGFDPFYVYRWHTAAAGYHLSGMGPRGYQALGQRPAPKADLVLDQYPPGLDAPKIQTPVLPRPF